jgi:hypothetical protein
MGDESKEEGIELIVRRSPISGAGIARVHRSITDDSDFEEGKVVLVKSEDHSRVLRLVSDNMMMKGRISLREKDMARLKVKEGERVRLLPMKGVGDHLTKRFSFLKR